MSSEVVTMTQGESRLTPRGRQWQGLVREWERSGQSMREFCGRRGLKPATMSWWRHEIKRRGGEPHDAGRVELVEIGRGVSAAQAEHGFEIELANRVRVRVPVQFDAAALRELLAVLGAC